MSPTVANMSAGPVITASGGNNTTGATLRNTITAAGAIARQDLVHNQEKQELVSNKDGNTVGGANTKKQRTTPASKDKKDTPSGGAK